MIHFNHSLPAGQQAIYHRHQLSGEGVVSLGCRACTIKELNLGRQADQVAVDFVISLVSQSGPFGFQRRDDADCPARQ